MLFEYKPQLVLQAAGVDRIAEPFLTLLSLGYACRPVHFKVGAEPGELLGTRLGSRLAGAHELRHLSGRSIWGPRHVAEWHCVETLTPRCAGFRDALRSQRHYSYSE